MMPIICCDCIFSQFVLVYYETIVIFSNQYKIINKDCMKSFQNYNKDSTGTC